MLKHIYGDRSQIPDKRTTTKPTVWLKTPTKLKLRQNPA
jgi:hypothetical protein